MAGPFTQISIRLLTAVALSGILSSTVDATIVGVTPILRPGYSDFSQNYDDHTFSPFPGHPAWWPDPGPTCMCGPATAANAAFWFADLHGLNGRLSQVQSGGSWVDASPGDIIEEFAVRIGAYEGWIPNGDAFPGTSAGAPGDANYLLGQRDFYIARGITPLFTYIRAENATSDFFFSSVVAALESRQAVEMSNVGHWFSISGARTDQFNDNNGNGAFDAGDSWLADYNNNGVFDRYFFVNNPLPLDAMEGWETFYELGTNFYISDDARVLDSVFLVRVAPEPSSLILIIAALASLVICVRRRSGPSSESRARPRP